MLVNFGKDVLLVILIVAFVVRSCKANSAEQGTNSMEQSTVPNNGYSSPQFRRMSPHDRKNNTQLLSLLAARRRQMIQNRLTHLTTIADTVSETTTQLNHILSTIIPQLRNSTTHRVYIDIRSFRGNNKTDPTSTNLTPTILSPTTTTTRENVSQLAQNSSKLYRSTKRLPLDLEQVSYDTFGGIPEKIDEDLLQVEESNHDLYLVNFTTKSMPDSLYNHFRPLETNLPDDEIQPFIHFGQKIPSSTLSPTTTPTKRNDESSLMDLSIERQNNIANKVLNIRPKIPYRIRPTQRNRTYSVPKRSFKRSDATTTKLPVQVKVVTSVSVKLNTEIVTPTTTTTPKFQIIVPDEVTTYDDDTTSSTTTTTPTTTTLTSTTTTSTTTTTTTTTTSTSTTTTPRPLSIRQNPIKTDIGMYILLATCIGILPLTIIVGFIIRNILSRRFIPNKSGFDSESSDILSEKTCISDKKQHKPHQPPMFVGGSNNTPTTNNNNSTGVNNNLLETGSSRWEFSRMKLRMKTLLGEGNFGQVWKAEADDLKGHDGLTRLVAVKTIKDGAGVKEREDLHRELFIMQKIGSHPNVVQLLGCCTEKEPYLLIMEYVMYGKLLTYLRDHRTRRDYYNFSDDAATLTSRDLTAFAYCVARGMEYLSSKGIIHRDLAARNILVDHNKQCKISDFGLSRYSPTKEVKEPRQPKNALPVRWMATESLLYSVFTEKTDVWAFGILLWEIVTLGATPYANMSGREVMHCVCDGYRLERPGHCKPELHRVMSRTWLSDPNQRPTFSELRNELAELLENNSIDYSYVDLESFAADSQIYEITNVSSRGNYCTIQSRISEFECDI